MRKIPNCIFEFVGNGTVCVARKTNSSGEYVGIELYDYQSKGLIVYVPFKKEEVNNARDKFYEWESDKYGQDTPLSDDDKDIWIEGYLYAKGRK